MRHGDSDWVGHVDDASGEMYYHNERTDETVWELPVELREPTSLASGGTGSRRESTSAHAGGGWYTRVDEASGERYFYHAENGETSWETPAELLIAPSTVAQTSSIGPATRRASHAAARRSASVRAAEAGPALPDSPVFSVEKRHCSSASLDRKCPTRFALCLRSDGLHFIGGGSKRSFERVWYADIYKWGNSERSFYLSLVDRRRKPVAGEPLKVYELKLRTPRAAEISSVLAQRIADLTAS